MKEKDTFMAAQAKEIRELIAGKIISDTPTQKRIRDQIRALAFFITDFTNKNHYCQDFNKYTKIVG